MPFKSEAQRRYLWANEPEIARDWTDTYGSRIQKTHGGIMHNFANYAHDDGNNVSVPRSFQARPHSDQVNLAYITPQEQGILQSLKPGTPHRGPMEIPNYDSFDAQGDFRSGQEMSAAESGDKNAFGRDPRAQKEAQDIRLAAIAAGAGQTVNPGLFGPRHRPEISKEDLRAAKASAPDAYRATRGSPFGIGNLFRGAMGMFGGWPGTIGSMLSRIDPRQLRGKNPDDSWRTQKQWQDAHNLRRDEKRMAYLSDRRARGLDFGDQAYADLLAGQGYSGEGIPDLFQNAIDKHSIDLDPDARIQDTSFSPQYKLPYEEFTDDIALSKQMSSLQSDAIPYEEFGGGITEIDTFRDTIGPLGGPVEEYYGSDEWKSDWEAALAEGRSQDVEERALREATEGAYP